MSDYKEHLPEHVEKNLTGFKVRKIDNPEKYGGYSKGQFWIRRFISLIIWPIGFIVGIAVSRNKNKVKAAQGKELVIDSIFIGILSIIAVFAFSTPEDSETIQMVKNGYLNNYQSKTIGEAFDDFFAGETWSSFELDGSHYVNVKGKISYHDKPVTAVIQFNVDKETGSLEIEAFEINEVPQDLLVLFGLLEKVYESTNPGQLPGLVHPPGGAP